MKTQVSASDREQWIITTECIKPIERYENGKVKKVQLRFLFKHL